jgi:hypothetical protein
MDSKDVSHRAPDIVAKDSGDEDFAFEVEDKEGRNHFEASLKLMEVCVCVLVS